MPFRATNVTPADGYREARQIAVRLLNRTTTIRDNMAAGDYGADLILNLMEQLKNERDLLLERAAIPGIVQFAADQEDDPTYDVAAEFTALIAAIDAAIDNIHATFPTSTFMTLDDETQTFQQFTPANTATLRGFLDAVIAAVE